MRDQQRKCGCRIRVTGCSVDVRRDPVLQANVDRCKSTQLRLQLLRLQEMNRLDCEQSTAGRGVSKEDGDYMSQKKY